MLEIMIKEERRVARLIDELLDLGRIRSGQLELELTSFDLCELVREVSAQMEVQAAGAGSKVDVELGGPVVGHWDRSRLNQVVTNLVANALKYGQGRPVIIRVAADSRARVRARGERQRPGIPPNFTDESSSRSSAPSATGQQDGLGLGLFIVRSIVEQLGGAVRVDSRPGAGATFVVDLPVQVTH